MSIKTIPEKKIHVCDICEDEDNEVAGKCPICDKDYCEECEQPVFANIFGEAGTICNNCGDIIDELDDGEIKALKGKLYEQVMSELRKVVILDNLDDKNSTKKEYKGKIGYFSQPMKHQKTCKICNQSHHSICRYGIK